MTNKEVVDAFIIVLLDAPDLTMHEVSLRLSATDYELRLLKADPLKALEKDWEELPLFPLNTGEKGTW